MIPVAVDADAPGRELPPDLTEHEIDFLDEVESVMESQGLSVVRVTRQDVHLRVWIEDDQGVEARLVGLDEVWVFAKSDHKECSGRGYRVLRTTDGSRPKHSVPVLAELNVSSSSDKPSVEFRHGCNCSGSRFIKEHPEVLIFAQSREGAYAAWPPTEGTLRIAPQASAPVSDGQRKLSDGEKAKIRAVELRQEAAGIDVKAEAMNPEIAGAAADFEAEHTRLSDLRSAAEQSKSEYDAEIALLEAEVASAEARLAQARVDLREKEDDLHEKGTVARAMRATLDARVATVTKSLDALGVPPRLRRLRKEQRILRDKAEALRERAKRSEERRS